MASIITERFLLRNFTIDDVADLHEILKDPMVNEFLPWLPSKSIMDTKRFLTERVFPEYEKAISYFYAIEANDTKKVIGYIDIGSLDEKKRCGELGYGIHRRHWNQQVATEAAKALIEQLRKDGFAYVYATCDQNNIASGRVMQKCGMSYRYSYEETWHIKPRLVTFRFYQLDLDGHHQETDSIFWDRFPNHFIESI